MAMAAICHPTLIILCSIASAAHSYQLSVAVSVPLHASSATYKGRESNYVHAANLADGTAQLFMSIGV